MSSFFRRRICPTSRMEVVRDMITPLSLSLLSRELDQRAGDNDRELIISAFAVVVISHQSWIVKFFSHQSWIVKF